MSEAQVHQDLPGVTITADDITKVLQIHAGLEVFGDAIIRGRVVSL